MQVFCVFISVLLTFYLVKQPRLFFLKEAAYQRIEQVRKRLLQLYLIATLLCHIKNYNLAIIFERIWTELLGRRKNTPRILYDKEGHLCSLSYF